MVMKTNSSTILILVTVLAVAAGAYWYFFAGTGNAPPLTTSTDVNSKQAEFQTLLGELQSIKFDTTIFDDTRFKALVDITVPVSSETVGRTDPFASVSGAGASAANATLPNASTVASPPAYQTGG